METSAIVSVREEISDQTLSFIIPCMKNGVTKQQFFNLIVKIMY